MYPVTVRFTDPTGTPRTAETDVAPALTAGSTVRVRVNADGKITDPPLTMEQVRNRAMGWAVLAAMAVPVLGATVHGYANRGLERHHLAQWDAAWAETAPVDHVSLTCRRQPCQCVSPAFRGR
ncbi:Rv1733c family protein [Streptomyces canus]|uniref:Rv1733c family protein n=1 Tax=Streptomyces canus TaxID=58343 RepID=UPI003F53E800